MADGQQQAGDPQSWSYQFRIIAQTQAHSAKRVE